MSASGHNRSMMTAPNDFRSALGSCRLSARALWAKAVTLASPSRRAKQPRPLPPHRLSSPPRKIFHFTEFRIDRTDKTSWPETRGGSRSSRTAGWAAMDATASGVNRHCRAASAVSNRFAPTTRRRQRLRMASGVSTRQHSKSQRRRARTNKSCGPDARGLCVKSCGDEAARPGARISYPQGDGGNSASLPGESTKDTLKPSRREGRAIRRTCGPPRVHFYGARTLRVPAGARPSLRPFLEGGAKRTVNLGHNMPREGDGVAAV
jgi:hypothetical protein